MCKEERGLWPQDRYQFPHPSGAFPHSIQRRFCIAPSLGFLGESERPDFNGVCCGLHSKLTG